jgi:phage shock protein E
MLDRLIRNLVISITDTGPVVAVSLHSIQLSCTTTMKLEAIIQQPDVTLIDVREPFEFILGHAKGAINIPLGSIPQRMNEIRAFKGSLIVYCRSGNRSGQAVHYLHGQGMRQVYNGGTVAEVNSLLDPRA